MRVHFHYKYKLLKMGHGMDEKKKKKTTTPVTKETTMQSTK